MSEEKYCKYEKMQRWVSYDSGLTWSPLQEFRTGDLIEEYSEDCGYIPTPTPSYETQYLTFRAREAGTFSFSNAMSYSLDSGTTWTTLEGGTSTPTIQSGETVMWKGNSRPYQGGGIGTFSSTGAFDVEGNAMSLLFGDDFEGETSLVGKDYALEYLFSGCTNVINAENLILPATTLAVNCYYEMFRGCSSLTSAPELPATTLSNKCYIGMFQGCSSLTSAPELPATTLAEDCYVLMFFSCTSLTTAPTLSATTLADGCYALMFGGCSSLTTAPQLPATTLATYCYRYMFGGCYSLTTAPKLPATTLASNCYEEMFINCTSLSAVTCLATDVSASNCTKDWVKNVAPTGVFTKDASMNDWTIDSTSGIPIGWTVQDYQEHDYSQDYLTFRALESGTFSFVPTSSNTISYSLDSGTTWTQLASGASTPTVASGSTVLWKGNMAPISNGGIGSFRARRADSFDYTGEFDVEGNIMSLLYGDNFSGQTSLAGKDYAFNWLFGSQCIGLKSAENLVLPATTLAQGCYELMFSDCSGLTVAPQLPAIILTENCYAGMFQGCTSLTTAPVLVADVLESSSYEDMFDGCTSLSYIKCLATDTTSDYCTLAWVSNVAASGTFIKRTGMNDWGSGVNDIPVGWTVQDYLPTPEPEEYLTFVAIEDGTFSFSGADDYVIQYSTNYGVSWSSPSSSVTTPTIHSGETVIWKGVDSSDGWLGIGVFSSSGGFNVQGNVMSVIYGDNFKDRKSFYTKSLGLFAAFNSLFKGCTHLYSAENLQMPAIRLEEFEYSDMFYGCTSLTKSPVLPAPRFCLCNYEMMFLNCTSLNNVTCLATYYGNDDEYCGDCMGRWLENVSPTGTFTKAAGMTSWPRGDSGIPNGWTIQDYQP